MAQADVEVLPGACAMRAAFHFFVFWFPCVPGVVASDIAFLAYTYEDASNLNYPTPEVSDNESWQRAAALLLHSGINHSHFAVAVAAGAIRFVVGAFLAAPGDGAVPARARPRDGGHGQSLF